jgi:endonuclease/exonuclease/phosphatase family metal-dependent hydrolase
MVQLNTGSLNILHPDFAVRHNEADGLIPGTNCSNWSTRKERIVTVLNDSKLDVICLQEISRANLNEILPHLVGYAEASHEMHQSRGDGVAILYKTDRLVLKQKHTFEPVHGMMSACVDLSERASGKIVRVASCHLKGGGSPEGINQINSLVERVETTPGFVHARVIAGDFNADANREHWNSARFRSLREKLYQHDDSQSPTEPKKNRRIDWVWIKASEAHEVQSLPIVHETVSAHIISATKLVWKNRTSFQPVGTASLVSPGVSSHKEGVLSLPSLSVSPPTPLSTPKRALPWYKNVGNFFWGIGRAIYTWFKSLFSQP